MTYYSSSLINKNGTWSEVCFSQLIYNYLHLLLQVRLMVGYKGIPDKKSKIDDCFD